MEPRILEIWLEAQAILAEIEAMKLANKEAELRGIGNEFHSWQFMEKSDQLNGLIKAI